MRIHYLQHVAFEGPAIVGEWASNNGHIIKGTHLYNNEELPLIDHFDWLIVLGGPMNIYEDDIYPWLRAEKKFIHEAIKCGKVVLGICLGAQLIADVLGGKITKNPEREIGWMQVDFKDDVLNSALFNGFPKSPYVFQWHGDTFSVLGDGCRCIADSEACKNQAFIYMDRVIGFQFHMESTKESISALIKNCSNDITNDTYVQSEQQIMNNMSCVIDANSLMFRFLDQLESL
jgi:GMP synthase-like glutamine amidotransferase